MSPMVSFSSRFRRQLLETACLTAMTGACSAFGGPAFESVAGASHTDAGGQLNPTVGGAAGSSARSDGGGGVGARASGGTNAGGGGTSAAPASGGTSFGGGAATSGGAAASGATSLGDSGGTSCGAKDSADCQPLKASLAHRYSFNGTGTLATDSVAGAHGTIVNSTLTNTNTLVLAGGSSRQYVDLPNGIVSALTDATFEVWLTWTDGGVWQRIFDFGTSGTEDMPGTGTAYFFLSPHSGLATPTMRAGFTLNGRDGETAIDGPVLTAGTLKQVTVVVNDTADTFALYVDGQAVASTTFTQHLSELTNVNNWLGRSQFSADADLGATLTEFRIYRVALTAKQVAFTYAGGPDPEFLR